MYHLETVVDGHVTFFPLLPGSNRLGRGGANEIVISNPHVSREHALIIVEEDRLTIRDLNSSHGTWVNRIPITEPAQLRPGDSIRLGDQDLVLRHETPSAGEETPGDRRVFETSVRLSAPEDVHSSTQLDATEVRSETIQSPTVTYAMMVALTEAGNLLAGYRPLVEVFDHVLELVEQVIPARRILLLTLDTAAEEPVVRAARPPGTGEKEPLVLSRTIVATVLEGRKAMLLNDIPHDLRFMMSKSVAMQKLRSALVAPLFDNTDVIGLLYADDDRLSSTYDSDHLRAFTLLANVIAIKITNTRLHEAEQTKLRLEEEMATAGRIQRSMLPRLFPEIAGYSMTAFNEPSQEVGGDLYDVARLKDGRVAVVIGDVSGKGIGAALLMSNVMACLRVLYQECLDPCELAERLHQELLQSTEPGYFVTLFFGLLDAANHRLDYVNAGHNPPLLLSANSEARLLPATGLPLGLVPDGNYETASVEVPPDSLLCLYSDGIPEAWTGSDFYGEERFEATLLALRSRPLNEISGSVLQDVRVFLGSTPPSDDITLFLLRRGGEPSV